MTTSIEFTEAQQDLASRISRIVFLVRSQEAADTKARQDVATANLSSFNIDALVEAASWQRPLHTLNIFLRKMDKVAVISEHGRVLEITDEVELQALMATLKEATTEAFLEWYKPNSTSNIDVEIKLGEHVAWQQAMKVASGSRF